MQIFFEDITTLLSGIALPDRMLAEASAAMGLNVQKQPAATQLIKHMHTQMGLPHDTKFDKMDRVPWSEIKDYNKFVLIRCKNGWAAIRGFGSGSGYNLVTSGAEGMSSHSSSRVDNIASVMKDNVGPAIRGEFYLSGAGHKSADTKRSDRRKSASADPKNRSLDLGERFRPLFVRYIIQAEAELKNKANNLMKARAYQKAANTIRRLDNLKSIHQQIENGEPIPSQMRNSIQEATKIAAAHYYPDLAGEVERSYSGYRVDNNAVNALLKDIKAGDLSKLSGIMAYFKQELISGTMR